MKTFSQAITLLLAISLLSCNMGNEKHITADLIITNATIYTVDNEFSTAQCMAILDGKIIDIGSNSEILEKYSSKEVIDFAGKFVYPGFIDPHAHFFGYGKSLLNADLYGAKSFEEVIEIIKKHHNDYPSEWILGRGWDQNEWDVKEFPNRTQIDKVFPDVPVLLRRVDGHAAIANTEALNRAGIKKAKEVIGGKIEFKNGELTGILIGSAIYLVDEIIPKPKKEVLIEALINGQNNLFAVGLTSIGDAGLEKETILMIDSLHKSGKLKLKIYAMLSPTEENFEHFASKGYYKTSHLNVRSIKLFADGALGSRGAKLLEPYSDDIKNSGILENTVDFLQEIAQKAYDYDYQLNTHCIGDSANRLMLNIYGDLLKEQNDRRWRIEHAQIVHPNDIDKFRKFSIIPSIQAIHATSDMLWAINRLGKERIINAYALKALLNQNGWLPNGSDFPVEPINPLFGFYAAFERKNADGIPEGGFQMENALTREEALKAMTIWSAKAQFEEQEKGSLEIGKYADFVVFDKDIMTIPGHEILTLKVYKTYVNGELVYENK